MRKYLQRVWILSESFFWHLPLTWVCFSSFGCLLQLRLSSTSVLFSAHHLYDFLRLLICTKVHHQHQIDHRINANVMANFCAKFELFLSLDSTNIHCLRACVCVYICAKLLTRLFLSMRIFINENKSSRIRKTSHKNY